MTDTPRPHDLLWLNDSRALQGIDALWVSEQWKCQFPVVVRRDLSDSGLIPVGVRGVRRDQRAAGWVAAQDIVRVATPESLACLQALLRSPFVSQPPVQAAIQLAQRTWPWAWGITGSAGYALATEMPVLHAESDLDLTVRAPVPVTPAAFADWQRWVTQLPCRADTQVETPFGAFSLTEWLRDGRVLLKTNRGPLRVVDPWCREDA
ncbi:malonate decarboxylase holo-ACP synthase [Cronobacter dublinensis]